MNTAISPSVPATRIGRGWQIGFWAAQILLALAYGFFGFMKVTTAPSVLVTMNMAWAGDVPLWFLRFIGVIELAGAVGLILPALTRILPVLTPLAATGLAVLQVFAIVFHATRGETAMTLPLNIVLLALALFIMWGRFRKAPILSR
jgi:hypothetical protein